MHSIAVSLSLAFLLTLHFPSRAAQAEPTAKSVQSAASAKAVQPDASAKSTTAEPGPKPSIVKPLSDNPKAVIPLPVDKKASEKASLAPQTSAAPSTPAPIATALDANATPGALEQKVRSLLDSKRGTDGELILKLSGDMQDPPAKEGKPGSARQARAIERGTAAKKDPSVSANDGLNELPAQDAEIVSSGSKQQPLRGWQWVGQRGSKHWGRLDPENIQCSQGRLQAPIAIATAEVFPGTIAAPTMNYGAASFKIERRGPALALNLLTNSKVQFRGAYWALDHIQFRRPGEYFNDGQQAQATIQFYHRQDSKQLILVVPVEIQEGVAINHGLRQLLQRIPFESDDRVQTQDVEWFPESLLPPEVHAAVTYIGSLSHPPCTEGVVWLILETPLLLNPAQFSEFEALVPKGHRPAQASHSRAVVRVQVSRQ